MRSSAHLPAENLDACIKCSACTAQCPVASVYPLFPGPKAAGPDAERFRLEGIKFLADSLSYCSNCKTCETTCPSGVKIMAMIGGNLRSAQASGQLPVGRPQRLRARLLGRAEYWGRIGSLWPGFANFFLRLKPLRLIIAKVMGISAEAPLPKYQRKFEVQKTNARAQIYNYSINLPANKSAADRNNKRALYFPGCYATFNDPVSAEKVVKVLAHHGYEVIVPDFSCCGVPLAANAQFEQENANIRRNLTLMQPYLEQGVPIITSCPSCGLALKEEYPQAKVPGADLIGSLTYDLFEFLGDLLEKEELRLDFQQASGSVDSLTELADNIPRAYGYHAACHLLAQGIGTPAVRLLRLIPGIKVVDVDGGCCGMSGSYGLKVEKYNLGQEIGHTLFTKIGEGVRRENFSEILTDCGMCRTQIEHATDVNTIHPVRILAAAYGITP